MKSITDIGIILDGSDQQGKSLFAEKLKKVFNHKIIHYDRPIGVNDYYFEYTQYLNNNEKFIFDRNYLSEIVYGNLFRGKSGVTPEIQTKIEEEYNRQDYIFILCNRRNFDNIQSRDEMYSNDEIIKAKLEFLKAFETIKMFKAIVDPFENEKAINEVIDLASLYINKTQRL